MLKATSPRACLWVMASTSTSSVQLTLRTQCNRRSATLRAPTSTTFPTSRHSSERIHVRVWEFIHAAALELDPPPRSTSVTFPLAVATLKLLNSALILRSSALCRLLLELNGPMLVSVRCCPAQERDAAASSSSAGKMTFGTDGKTVAIQVPPKSGMKAAIIQKEEEPQCFSFDSVFGPRASQEEVFSPLAHFVLGPFEGYCNTIFAYGQVRFRSGLAIVYRTFNHFCPDYRLALESPTQWAARQIVPA
jgi:hypothetical protein